MPLPTHVPCAKVIKNLPELLADAPSTMTAPYIQICSSVDRK